MSATPVSPSYYADFGAMEALKQTARQHQPAAVREAARQFESLFTSMLLKSMREASLGESLGDSEQTRFYQDMFDQQLALQLSKGKGLGLAEHLVQQLRRGGGAAAGARAAAADPPTADNPAVRTRFIDSIRPYAIEAAQRLGVAPESIIAHAALETGWGQHLPAGAAGSSNNLFGVKAGSRWRGPAADATTTEYVGVAPTSVRTPFRAYESVAASMRDYARLLGGNPRFAAALNRGQDVVAFAMGLQRGGYATDPAYVQKLVATASAVRELAGRTVLKNATALPMSSGGESA
jgi:peptidoglycan hydrolase FlgJ